MIFDELRKQNANWYTANPLSHMSQEELEKTAQRAGVSVQDLLKAMNTTHIEATCPLCGKPQTHLSDCKGCGTGAFTNWDFEEAYGKDARKRLKDALKTLLVEKYGEAGDYAAKNAYDCMICASCWQETIQSYEAYQTCPLRLFADLFLQPGFPQVVLMEVGWKQTEPRVWFESVWRQWTTNKEAKAWRGLLLGHVFVKILNTKHKKRDVNTIVQETLDFLGREEDI